MVAFSAIIESLNSVPNFVYPFPVATKIVLVVGSTEAEPQILEPFVPGALELK